jgi:hypothetical protein
MEQALAVLAGDRDAIAAGRALDGDVAVDAQRAGAGRVVAGSNETPAAERFVAFSSL